MNKDNNSPEHLNSAESPDDESSSDSKNAKSENKESKSDDSKQDNRLNQENRKDKRASFFEPKDQPEEQKRLIGISKKESDEPKVDISEDKNADEDEKLASQEDLNNNEVELGLNEDEAQEVATVIIDARNEELTEELRETEEDSPEELEVLADVAFLESLRERLENGEELTEDTIENAFDETIEDLGVSIEDLSDDSQNEGFDSEEVDEILENPDNIDEVEQDLATNNTNASSLPQNHPQSPQTPVVPPTPPVRPPAPASIPVSPTPPQPPQTGNPNQYSYNAANPNINNNQNTATNYVERRRRGRDLLVGGIVGYIIGRRGGRKRTEKRLVPKIEQLEHEVATLHDAITEKEVKIRKIARKNAETEYKLRELEDSYNSSDSKDIPSKNSKNNTRNLSVNLIENRQKRVEIKQTLKRREELSAKVSVEKLSKFTLPALEVFRERRIIDGTENSPKRKRFEVMTENELLEQAEGITIDGASVVKMYHEKRISREGLLEVVKKYYRQGTGSHERVYWSELKNDPKELEKRRQNLESLHQSHNTPLNQPNGRVINDDNVSDASESEKKNYYQRNAESILHSVTNAQKKETKKTLTPWIALIVVLAIILVGYLILSQA